MTLLARLTHDVTPSLRTLAHGIFTNHGKRRTFCHRSFSKNVLLKCNDGDLTPPATIRPVTKLALGRDGSQLDPKAIKAESGSNLLLYLAAEVRQLGPHPALETKYVGLFGGQSDVTTAP
jgi:hypothetical protein